MTEQEFLDQQMDTMVNGMLGSARGACSTCGRPMPPEDSFRFCWKKPKVAANGEVISEMHMCDSLKEPATVDGVESVWAYARP